MVVKGMLRIVDVQGRLKGVLRMSAKSVRLSYIYRVCIIECIEVFFHE